LADVQKEDFCESLTLTHHRKKRSFERLRQNSPGSTLVNCVFIYKSMQPLCAYKHLVTEFA
jgi:hypothetical protein